MEERFDLLEIPAACPGITSGSRLIRVPCGRRREALKCIEHPHSARGSKVFQGQAHQCRTPSPRCPTFYEISGDSIRHHMFDRMEESAQPSVPTHRIRPDCSTEFPKRRPEADVVEIECNVPHPREQLRRPDHCPPLPHPAPRDESCTADFRATMMSPNPRDRDNNQSNREKTQRIGNKQA